MASRGLGQCGASAEPLRTLWIIGVGPFSRPDCLPRIIRRCRRWLRCGHACRPAPDARSPTASSRAGSQRLAITARLQATGLNDAREFVRKLRLPEGEEDLRYYNAVALYETGNYQEAQKELACALPFIQVTEDVTRNDGDEAIGSLDLGFARAGLARYEELGDAGI